MTWLLALIAISAIGGLVVLSLKAPPQAPQVHSNQQPHGAAKREAQSNHHTNSADQPATIEQQHAANNSQRETDKDADKRADEAREYWPFHIFGWARLKITDSLLAVFTFLLIVVGAIQGVFLYRTDQGTHKAADAAKDSAEIAERALIAGQRAFVSVSYQTSAGRDFKTKNIVQWIFTPIWTNAGNTPTRNMANHINVGVRDAEIDDDFDFPDQWNTDVPPEKRRPVPLGIAPKAWISGQAVGISVGDIDAAINGKKFLYIWGWASYEDVFPRTALHVTRFANRIAVGGDAHNPAEISFSFPLLWKYNCSDEECTRQGYPPDWRPRVSDEPTGAPAVIDPQPGKQK